MSSVAYRKLSIAHKASIELNPTPNVSPSIVYVRVPEVIDYT